MPNTNKYYVKITLKTIVICYFREFVFCMTFIILGTFLYNTSFLGLIGITLFFLIAFPKGNRIPYAYEINKDAVHIWYYFFFLRRCLIIPREQLSIEVKRTTKKLRIEFHDNREVLYTEVIFAQYSENILDASFWEKNDIEHLIRILEHYEYTPNNTH